MRKEEKNEEPGAPYRDRRLGLVILSYYPFFRDIY